MAGGKGPMQAAGVITPGYHPHRLSRTDRLRGQPTLLMTLGWPMYDRFYNDPYDPEDVEVAEPFPPLPAWLADRLLQPRDTITWVRGPRLNPPWQRYVTHPA